MPLYEYRCKACGHRFEKIQSFSAPDEKECPVCKGEVERLISAPAVHFSGSGFYSTDYKSPSASNSSSESRSKETASKSEGSKDSSSTSSGDGGSKSSSEGSSSAPAASSAPASSSSAGKE